MSAALDTIARALADIKHDPSVARRINASTDLLTDVGLDSLELTELMLRLEEDLDVELDLSEFDLRFLRRAGDLAAFLSR